MFLDHSAERRNDTGFRDEKQQRKGAVTVLVILRHQVVDGLVQQTRIGEGAADAAAFFRRAIAQRIVHECGSPIGIHLVKITNGFLTHCGRRIVKQAGDLIEWSVLWVVTTLGEFVRSLTKCGYVSSPPLIDGAPRRGLLSLLH